MVPNGLTSEPEEIVYPNSPLIEVVCELRFPGDLSIETKRDVFYDSLRDKYPNILVPQLKSGEAPLLTPIRFENRATNSGVLLAINKFGYFEREYKGHNLFFENFLEQAKNFTATFSKIKSLTRFGWRYINVIPFKREDGEIPLDQIFNFNISFGHGPKVYKRFENLNLVFITKCGAGEVTTKIESALEKDTSQEVIVLDFDFAFTKDLSTDGIESYLKLAHRETRGLFDSLITDEYKSYLQGDSL
jgi:uncharacterized protein (TIGR04255 family)